VSSSGTIWLGENGSLRIEYENAGRIVSDGDTIWMYVPESEQVFISRADTSNLLSPARLVSHFIVRSDSVVFERTDEGWTAEFHMKPGKKLEYLSAVIRESDYFVPELVMKDSEGNETEVKLEYIRKGIEPGALFVFDKPAGAEVIRN
jgi:outer membrane lipoprotein-sorting protein